MPWLPVIPGADIGQQSARLPALLWLGRRELMRGFPPLNEALTEPNGLLAAGGDLHPHTLIEAYRHGIFPWYSAGEPILWWSPEPRTVFHPDAVHISRSLDRTLKRQTFHTSCNRAFDAVIDGCAAPRQNADGTWITREMRAAYRRLAAMGVAHSVEVWQGDDLMGGLYGVALGRIFFGESMFSRASDASKVALANLGYNLTLKGYTLIDCQVASGHLLRMGAEMLSREAFETALAQDIDANDVLTPSDRRLTRHDWLELPDAATYAAAARTGGNP